jgi:hypothetical protein
MELAGLLQISAICVAGSIGLRLCRLMLRTNAGGLERQAAAGLITALARFGPLSGGSSQSIARTRGLCACALIPDRTTRAGRIHGLSLGG